MSTLKTRLDRLEENARPTLAAALGEMCIVETLTDGRKRLHDGRIVTDEELRAIVRSAGGGRVLDLNLYPDDGA